jgi:hypothetical protein
VGACAFPKLDRRTFGIGQLGKPPIGVRLNVHLNLDAGTAQLWAIMESRFRTLKLIDTARLPDCSVQNRST